MYLHKLEANEAETLPEHTIGRTDYKYYKNLENVWLRQVFADLVTVLQHEYV